MKHAIKNRNKFPTLLLCLASCLALLLALPLSLHAEDGGNGNLEEDEEIPSGVPYQYFYDEDERQGTAYVHPDEAEKEIVDLSSTIEQALTDGALTFVVSSGANTVTLNRTALDVVKKAMDQGKTPIFYLKKTVGDTLVNESLVNKSLVNESLFPPNYGENDVRYDVSIGALQFPDGAVLVKVRHTAEDVNSIRMFTYTEDSGENALKSAYKKGSLYFYATDSTEFFVTEKQLPASKAPMYLALLALACTVVLSVVTAVLLKTGTLKRWVSKKGTE